MAGGPTYFVITVKEVDTQLNKCYKIHGYPGNNSKQGGRGKTFRATNNGWGESEGQTEAVSPPSSMLLGLTQEQSKLLLQFLSTLTSGTKFKSREATVSAADMASTCYALNGVHNFSALRKNTWILDSGASECMSSRQSSLHDLCVLDCLVLVNLPNGTKVKVTHQGKLKISSYLVSDHVPLVPHLKFIVLFVKRHC